MAKLLEDVRGVIELLPQEPHVRQDIRRLKRHTAKPQRSVPRPWVEQQTKAVLLGKGSRTGVGGQGAPLTARRSSLSSSGAVLAVSPPPAASPSLLGSLWQSLRSSCASAKRAAMRLLLVCGRNTQGPVSGQGRPSNCHS